MKKILWFLTALIVTSCGLDIDYLSELEITKINYEGTFKNTFGQIAPNQTWGFVQNVTRSANPNKNEWNQIISPITEDELNNVLNVFNLKGNTSYESLVNWSNFYVQQVYTGPNGNKMNELATTVDYIINTTVISWWPYEVNTVKESVNPFDDIINNFNNGNGDCMLMQNSATNDFSFKTSLGGGQRWYKHWRMEEINGNYYIGFDHESAKQGSESNENELDIRDYIYNDWIIKIIPFDIPKEEGRIICEDMGNIGDFDFNDVVFDATIYNDGTTFITILAAGGTLDISVDGINVGEVLGKMVNTGLKSVNTFNFESKNKYNNLIDIPIIVTKTNNAGIVTSYELSAKIGEAPQKICVPKTFRWCKEYKSIKDAYPGFTNWVTDGKFWSGEINESLIY